MAEVDDGTLTYFTSLHWKPPVFSRITLYAQTESGESKAELLTLMELNCFDISQGHLAYFFGWSFT